VGKVLEELLNKTGIYHFNQISNLTSDEISWLDNSMSFPGRIEREDWVSQATDLAEGKATEFSQRVERGEVSSSKKSN
jgi:NADH-quinone oxidoreductase subunit E